MTARLPFLSVSDLPAAAAAVRDAGAAHAVVAAPSDTYYGLSVRPADALAVERLLAVKRRESGKPLVVVAASMEQVDELVALPPRWTERLAAVWPAPLTVVAPARRVIAAGGETLAVRVPDHTLLRALLARVGPLTSTSANLAGGEPPCSAEEVLRALPEGVELLLDGGPTPGGLPSTLIECLEGGARLLRAGRFRPPREWRVVTP